jgi:hypothetical protein
VNQFGRSARINVRTGSCRLICCRACRNLVQILGDAEPVCVHAGVTEAHGVKVRQLPLDRQVPLFRLRVAIARSTPWSRPPPPYCTPTLGGAVLGNWISG